MNTLAADHAACADLLRRSGSSFTLPIRLLPPEKRRGTTALYAFCRRADDIVDDAVDPAAAGVALDAFGENLAVALAGGRTADPVIRAVVDTVRRFAVPADHLRDILDGVRMDLTRHSYETFADLEEYCRRVASAVGLAAIHIWGFLTPEAIPVSHACGMAFQLTNILRDIPEDLGRGRIYLPREDMVACGCSAEDLRAGDIHAGFARLAELEIDRAEGFFRRAEVLDRMLSTDGRIAWRSMFGVYRSLFSAVRRAGPTIFTSRVHPGRPRLVAAALSTLCLGPRRCRIPRVHTMKPANASEVVGSPENSSRVVVVGGGLAGLAAAAALVDSGMHVTVVEARRRAGGRAASFEDPVAGGLVDACQHVAMGCCTNFLDLCRQAGLADAIRRDRTLWFIGPDGDRAACTPSRLLPAPLHLAPLLLGMRHFTLGEKCSLALGMLRLARYRGGDDAAAQTARAWLESIGQPERVIRLFWQPVLESALGESIDLVSVMAARKVAVDGFLAHREAADLHVPTVPLGELFGGRLAAWLAARGVAMETGRTATSIDRDADGSACGVVCGDQRIPCDTVVVALPWKQATRLVSDLVPPADDRLAGSPITAVHLWFDRDVIDLPHAVLVGRVSQWVFRSDGEAGGAHGYCQVVISASRGLFEGDRGRLLDAVVGELRDVFPAARDARLVDARIVTDPTAVLSVRPGVEAARPEARTAVHNIILAGDWTATGWPSTMEGAIRSGRLAAEAVFDRAGCPRRVLAADLPKGPLVRLLLS
jgi:squalene-associated FAD-dependent desaturase